MHYPVEASALRDTEKPGPVKSSSVPVTRPAGPLNWTAGTMPLEEGFGFSTTLYSAPSDPGDTPDTDTPAPPPPADSPSTSPATPPTNAFPSESAVTDTQRRELYDDPQVSTSVRGLETLLNMPGGSPEEITRRTSELLGGMSPGLRRAVLEAYAFRGGLHPSAANGGDFIATLMSGRLRIPRQYQQEMLGVYLRKMSPLERMAAAESYVQRHSPDRAHFSTAGTLALLSRDLRQQYGAQGNQMFLNDFCRGITLAGDRDAQVEGVNLLLTRRTPGTSPQDDVTNDDIGAVRTFLACLPAERRTAFTEAYQRTVGTSLDTALTRAEQSWGHVLARRVGEALDNNSYRDITDATARDRAKRQRLEGLFAHMNPTIRTAMLEEFARRSNIPINTVENTSPAILTRQMITSLGDGTADLLMNRLFAGNTDADRQRQFQCFLEMLAYCQRDPARNRTITGASDRRVLNQFYDDNQTMVTVEGQSISRLLAMYSQQIPPGNQVDMNELMRIAGLNSSTSSTSGGTSTTSTSGTGTTTTSGTGTTTTSGTGTTTTSTGTTSGSTVAAYNNVIDALNPRHTRYASATSDEQRRTMMREHLETLLRGCTAEQRAQLTAEFFRLHGNSRRDASDNGPAAVARQVREALPDGGAGPLINHLYRDDATAQFQVFYEYIVNHHSRRATVTGRSDLAALNGYIRGNLTEVTASDGVRIPRLENLYNTQIPAGSRMDLGHLLETVGLTYRP